MAVDDIKKLRPELLEKSRAELKRLRDEIDLADAHLAREEEIKAKQDMADEANRHIDAVNEGVKFLQGIGQLPARIAAGFTRESDGMFSPSMFLRNVTAESLVGGPRKAPGAKRKRRTKAEIEALKASGEYKPRRQA